MTDEDAIKAAIRNYPTEDTPRLVYADWLEEHGERPEQAQFIRERRVGEHVGNLRQYAKTASTNSRYADQARDSFPYSEGTKARQRAKNGEHLKASELHDKAGDWYFEHSAHIQHAATEYPAHYAQLMHYRNSAMAHYVAAHHNEAVTHDLGSPASQMSVAALQASAHTNHHSDETNSLPNDQWNEVFRAREFSAAAAHRKAANMHELEGNQTTANRHRKIAMIHERRGLDLPLY